MTATMSGVGTGGRPLRPEGDDVRTYYGRPALKEPVWRAWIPTYLFAGGLAAGSSLLAAGASVCGDAAFARQSRLVAVGALGVGSVCLVADL